MKITIIGSGYVGLVSGVCFAEIGNNVLCFDLDKNKIQLLNDGISPIYEPGLDELIKKNISAGRLRFTSDVNLAVEHGLIQFIAVGTPSDEDGSADISHVLKAAQAIGQRMNEYKVIVNKSTVPVGTADKVRAVISNELKLRNSNINFSVTSNPEFLKEGAAIEDFMRPDRIIVGAEDEMSIGLLKDLYSPFHRNHERLILMDIKSAELTKYASNAMLATRISFMNELANLTEVIGGNIDSIRKGMGSDPRIGYQFLYPGCGYGGSCFPKDIRALIKTAGDHQYKLAILEEVEKVNDRQKNILYKKILHHFNGDLKNLHFAIWGLSFKPNTDDIREAPSLTLIDALIKGGSTICAYDPIAIPNTIDLYKHTQGISFSKTAPEALNNADALIIVTEWQEFRSPDFEDMKKRLKTAIIFDGRNLYKSNKLKDIDFIYLGIGNA